MLVEGKCEHCGVGVGTHASDCPNGARARKLASGRVEVLDHGFVVCREAPTSELSVVNAARVSLNKQHDELLTEGQERDDLLIGYLLRNEHGTPFEQNLFTFHVRAPIFVFRQWHRHRIGWSYNEMSGRYTELPEQFYVPAEEDVRTRVGKPGSYTYAPAEPEIARSYRELMAFTCRTAVEAYRASLDHGIAPEQARLMLPVNLYSEMVCTCNARSLMHFLHLRNDDHAQWEIRQYAIALEGFLRERMPVTYQAFLDNGRKAP